MLFFFLAYRRRSKVVDSLLQRCMDKEKTVWSWRQILGHHLLATEIGGGWGELATGNEFMTRTGQQCWRLVVLDAYAMLCYAMLDIIHVYTCTYSKVLDNVGECGQWYCPGMGDGKRDCRCVQRCVDGIVHNR